MLNEIFNMDKLFDTFNYVFWFFILNVLFWLFNIPLALFLIFIGITGIGTYLPLFLVCLIPTIPTFTVILYCMNKLYKNKTISPFRDFVRGFKHNFLQSLVVWCVELLMLFIIYSNIKFFSIVMNNPVLNGIFIGLLILITIVTPFLFLVISRFKMPIMSALRLSFTLTFTRPILTVTNILICLVFLILFELSPAILLFVSTLFAFAMIYINRALFNELEEIANKTN